MTFDLPLVNFDSPTEVRESPMGDTLCQVEHVGLVLRGAAVAKMEDETEKVMRAGDFFYIPPGQDSWVVGDEPYAR
jgi:glyoxylate utilization-related uncharacterized protein